MTTHARDRGDERPGPSDQRWTFGVLALLWAAVLFLFLLVLPFASPALAWTMGLGGAGLLAYSTASILGFTRRFHHRPDAGYGLEVRSLDRMPK
jgi:hypothetical protein